MLTTAAAPLTVTFDGNSSEAERTVTFDSQSGWARNEYNISVIDTNGVSVPGTVPGMVNLLAFSPGSDRAETTANQIDLSSGNRKFRLFIATISRAVFSVTGLAAGRRVRVTCVRGEP